MQVAFIPPRKTGNATRLAKAFSSTNAFTALSMKTRKSMNYCDFHTHNEDVECV